MLVEPAIYEASAAFAAEGSDYAQVGGRPHLIKLKTPEGFIRVRKWSPEVPRQRVAFVTDVRKALVGARVATAPKLILSSSGEPFIERDGRFFEAQEWREGRHGVRKMEPLDMRDRAMHAPAALPDDALAQIAAALAEWHLATASLATAQAPAAPLRSIVEAVAGQWTDDHALVRRHAMQQAVLQRWIRACEQAIPAVESALTAVNFLAEAPSVVAHFNVWPAHLLFERGKSGDRLTTLLDPTASAVSSPLIDIAQAITHGSGWTTAAAEIGLAAYSDVRRLTPEERRLLPAVAAIDLVAESGRLFRIAYASSQDADWQVVDFARAGGTAALISLETIIPAIRRATEAGPLFKARPWVRRPRYDAKTNKPVVPRPPKPKR
jgi:hypothetical protein